MLTNRMRTDNESEFMMYLYTWREEMNDNAYSMTLASDEKN